MNSLMLRLKAKELSSDPEFKASLGWYTNWKRRHAISMRAKTTLAQRLPADIEEKVIEFHRFVLRSRQRCGYEPSHILNMDETPMRFELPATRTLEFTGNRTVPILSCSGDKAEFHCCLGSEGKWRETSTESNLQRRSSASNPDAAKNAGFCAQEGLDG